VTIGRFGQLTPEQARGLAREALASARHGHDPADERRKEKVWRRLLDGPHVGANCFRSGDFFRICAPEVVEADRRALRISLR